MKSLNNCDELNDIIVPNMTDIIRYPYRNGKWDSYTESGIHDIYHYLYMLEAPLT